MRTETESVRMRHEAELRDPTILLCSVSDYCPGAVRWQLIFACYTTWTFNAIWLFDVDLGLTRIWVETLSLPGRRW